ncbi:hypothetical protein [Homoserinimonas hongtaonis]|nr:hypothetical protein [Salinibacterium hongtaonis]
MIGFAIAVAALSAWAALATIEVVRRDGYGRVPHRELGYSLSA